VLGILGGTPVPPLVPKREDIMLGMVSQVFGANGSRTRARVIGLYAFLIAVNIALWVVTILSSTRYAFLLPVGLLAYSFGLRHAVDADHISAIDNVTRKLMQEGKRPVAVGFFFSLGHSTIVFGLSAALAAASIAVQRSLPGLQNVGGLIGTLVSAMFLYLIAALNIVVLWDVFKTFRSVTRGGEYDEQRIEEFLSQRGLFSRFFKPLFRLISHSWNMYPVGFLFGLGFDTASEVAILAISATSATKGVPFLYILLLPLLFAAGMSLADTTDGILMLGAYGWAFIKPIRKLYYNLNITLISVLVALVVGTIEVLGIIAGELHLGGPFWGFVANLDFESLGYVIVGVFVVAWLTSTIIYRVKKYEHVETTSVSEGVSA
jgi:high-affinity nickel-transport protein